MMATKNPDITSPGPFTTTAVGAIVFLLPLLPGAAWYLGFPSRPLSDGLVVLLGCLALLAVLAKSIPGSEDLASRRIGWAWGLFTLLAAFSAMHGLLAEFGPTSPVFRAHLLELGTRWLLPVSAVSDPLYPVLAFATVLSGGLAYVSVYALSRRLPPRHRRALIAAFVAAGAAVALFAVVQKATGFQLHPYWVRVNPYFTRAHATMPDPNALGSFLLLLLAAAVALAADARWRALGFVAAALGVAGIFASGSRAAIIPLAGIAVPAGAWACWHWIHPQEGDFRWRRAATAGTLLIVLGGFLAAARPDESPADLWDGYYPGNSLDALAQTLTVSSGLDMGRGPWWELSLAYVRDYPVTGVGLGRFPCLLDANASRHAENAHNYPLQILAVMGVPGAMAFLGLALLTLWGVWRIEERPTFRSVVVATLYLGFLVSQLTGNALLEPSVQACWGVFLGLLLGGAHTRHGVRRRLVGALFLFAAAWGVWGAVRAGSGDLPGCRGDWGSTWGLYPVETLPGGVEYRWSGERAILDLSWVGGPGSPEREVRFLVEAPQATPRHPVRLWTSSGGDYEVLSLLAEVPQKMYLTRPEEGPWIVRLEVDGAFVPADQEGSDDSRLLGVKMSLVPASERRP